MEEGLEVILDDPAICAGDPGGSPIWMRDYSREWFRLEPLKRMIARMILKASTHWTNNRPTDQTNQPIKPMIDRLRPTDQVIKNNGLARPATLAKAKTNWEALDRTITITANIADGIKWCLESVKGLDQGLQIWNRPGVKNQPRRPWRFKRSRKLM